MDVRDSQPEFAASADSMNGALPDSSILHFHEKYLLRQRGKEGHLHMGCGWKQRYHSLLLFSHVAAQLRVCRRGCLISCARSFPVVKMTVVRIKNSKECNALQYGIVLCLFKDFISRPRFKRFCARP